MGEGRGGGEADEGRRGGGGEKGRREGERGEGYSHESGSAIAWGEFHFVTAYLGSSPWSEVGVCSSASGAGSPNVCSGRDNLVGSSSPALRPVQPRQRPRLNPKYALQCVVVVAYPTEATLLSFFNILDDHQEPVLLKKRRRNRRKASGVVGERLPRGAAGPVHRAERLPHFRGARHGSLFFDYQRDLRRANSEVGLGLGWVMASMFTRQLTSGCRFLPEWLGVATSQPQLQGGNEGMHVSDLGLTFGGVWLVRVDSHFEKAALKEPGSSSCSSAGDERETTASSGSTSAGDERGERVLVGREQVAGGLAATVTMRHIESVPGDISDPDDIEVQLRKIVEDWLRKVGE